MVYMENIYVACFQWLLVAIDVNLVPWVVDNIW